jgi:predicted PurR-regulated permease PerM
MSESAAWRVLSRCVLLVFGLLLCVFLISQLRGVIVQLMLALLLAAAASPVVDWLTASRDTARWNWRPGRGLAALLVFLAALLVLFLGAFIVLATVGPDLAALANNLPTYFTRAEDFIELQLANNPDVATRVSGALPSLQTMLGGAIGVLGQASRLLGVATSVLSGLLYLVFTLILALYLTIDGDRIRRFIIQFLPFDRHEQALTVTERIGVRLGAWARGEALLGVIIGVLTWIAALVIGLPYAGALALMAAIGELIPNLGPIIAAIPLVIVGFISSPTQGLLALGAAILIQQLENNLIVPRVMSRAVALHPVAVMVAILAGGELLGIPGALLAVPTIASLSVIVEEVQRERVERHVIASEAERELIVSSQDAA